MDLYIGLKRERAERLQKELAEALAQDTPVFAVEAHGLMDGQDNRDVTINISNDDMERDEVPADAIYVTFD